MLTANGIVLDNRKLAIVFWAVAALVLSSRIARSDRRTDLARLRRRESRRRPCLASRSARHSLSHFEPTREFHLVQAKRVTQRGQPHRVFAIRFREGPNDRGIRAQAAAWTRLRPEFLAA